MGLALFAGLWGAGCHHAVNPPSPPGPGTRAAAPSVAPTQPPGAALPEQPQLTTPPAPRPAKIRIVVRSTPVKATVRWGKKTLGLTPVTLERPRDSGPVDLVLRAPGFFPVHTRAYTFKSDAV